MAMPAFTPDTTVSMLARAFYNAAPGNTLYNQLVNAAVVLGDLKFSSNIGANFVGYTDASLAKLVLKNFGLITGTETTAPAVVDQLTNYFASAKGGLTSQGIADARGFIVLQVAQQLSSSESDATFGTAAKSWNDALNASVTYSATSTNVASKVGDLSAIAAIGQTYTLTTSPNTFTGGLGNDTFDGSTLNTFTSLDTLDGGAGDDTLNAFISDGLTGAPAAFTMNAPLVKNVENVSVTASVGNNTFTITNASTPFPQATKLTVGSSGGLKLDGGAGVVSAQAGAYAVDIGTTVGTANAYTSVAVTGGAAVTIEDHSGTSAAVGKTLTTVSLTGNTGNATVNTSTGLTTLNLTSLLSAVTTTVTPTTDGTRALTINTNGVTTTGAITDAKATTLTVANSGVKSTGLEIAAVKATAMNLSATGAELSIAKLTGATGVTKAVNISGDALVTVGTTAITVDAATVFTSTNTKGAVLTQPLAATQKFVGGAGGDTVSLVAQTTANTMGAGDDKVTLGADLGSGGSVDGGEGKDTLIIAVAQTDATKITGFEVLGVGANTLTLNAQGYTGLVNSTYTAAKFEKVAAGTGLTLNGAGAPATTVELADYSGTADKLAITLAIDTTVTGQTATTPVTGGTVHATGIEDVTIVSNGTATVAAPLASNSAVNSIVLGTDTTAKTVTITGAADTVLTFNAFGYTPVSTTKGVTLIDGSAATGKLYIDGSTGLNAMTNGLTIKGGVAADVIKGTAGNDTIIAGGGADVITGGVGADKITLSGNTSTLNLTNTNATTFDTGANNATATQTALLTSALDIVTGATVGTKFAFTLYGTASATTPLVTSATLATNLQGTDNNVVFARGTYDAANGIFNFGAAGADTVMTYDADMTATTDFHSVVLVGFVPSTTTAAGGSGTTTITLA